MHTVLAEPITKLINSSTSSEVFHECLKCARIVPIFKKGEPTNMSKYRPIAILPTISKIFEKIINRLLDFLDKSNSIIPQQFGFLKSRSTAGALLTLTQFILKLPQ